MRRATSLGLVVLGALAAAGFAEVGGGILEPRQSAVAYREFPEAGPEAADGRDLSGLRSAESGILLVGIDINSRVTVAFDAEKLAETLVPFLPEVEGDAETRALLARLRSLTDAANGTGELVASWRREIEAYETLGARATSKARVSAAQQATRERATIAFGILTALREAVTARQLRDRDILRLDADEQEDEAGLRADELVFPVLAGKSRDEPYDTTALGDLLNREIELVERDVAARLAVIGAGTTDVEIELRGHLVRRDGSATAVPLEGHNTVERCQENRVRKIDFELSAEERTLLAEYEALAASIAAAQAEGKELFESIKAGFEAQKLPLVEAIAIAETAFDTAKSGLETLVGWADASKLESWVRGPAKDALEGSQSAQDAFAGFRRLLEDTGTDFTTLEVIAGIGSIEQLDSFEAVTRIVDLLSRLGLKSSVERALDAEVWRFRIDAAADLLAPSGGNVLAPLTTIDGPIKAWIDAKAALDGLKTALEPIRAGAREALARLRGAGVAPIAVNLPEPAGQTRRAITADLDTEFDLVEVCGRRDEGDEVRLSYRFFVDDEQIEGAEWTDTFRLRFFGWRGVAKASIAMVRFTDSSNDDRWEPTAPVSYLLSRRAWPDAQSSGIGGRRTGSTVTFGLSTMPLDFSDEESVELGLTATIGLFDSFLILGYGINLQADEEEFFLLSLRPFSLGSMFAPAGPSQ